MNRGGLTAAGVFAYLAAASGILCGSVILSYKSAYCSDYNCYDEIAPTATIWDDVVASALQYAGSMVLIGEATCIFVFVSCDEHFENGGGDGNGASINQADALPQTITSSESKMKRNNTDDDATSISSNSSTVSVTKPFNHLPDGSVKTETQTTLPDGSNAEGSGFRTSDNEDEEVNV